MRPISSIAELPFRECDPLELLNLDDHRESPDADYYAYGHTRVARLCLLERNSPEPLPLVHNALVLALHSADDAEPLDRDIELEFFVDEVADDYSVTVLLSEFLACWLPAITSDERAVVLALCNPRCAIVEKPGLLGATPMYYAQGEVESWLDSDAGRPFIQLHAERWRLAV